MTDRDWCFENPDAAAAAIDDLEAKRDRLDERLTMEYHAFDILMAEYQKMTEERDALAAHVETLREALMKIDDDLEGRNFLVSSSLRDTAHAALDHTPNTPLARLKAKWQAEALEKLADNFAEAYTGRIRHEAAELRRQAKEAPSGHETP